MAAGPVFLARRSYRRRRLGDAARALPAFGAALLLLPATGAVPAGQGGVLYLFGAWGGLVAAAALLARPLSRPAGEGPDPAEPDPAAPEPGRRA